MANRNVNSEHNPRVPRHPMPSLTNTVPSVPEVSLAFDTPTPQSHGMQKRSSPGPATSYAQWKQQVPSVPRHSNNLNVDTYHRVPHRNLPTAPTPRKSLPVSTVPKPDRRPNDFAKDSRLKYYQKVTSPSSQIAMKVTTNQLPMKAPPAQRQEKSLVMVQDALQVSLNSEDRVEPLANSAHHCHSHQSANIDIINKLLSLVQSQNAQIEMLQGQVEKLLSIRSERRELDCHCSQASRKIQLDECERRDDKSKQLIKEKKVSIGVMTSFELTLQDSVVYNVDGQSRVNPQEISAPHSLGKISIPTRTPAPTKASNGPLQQIIEDSESHLSSILATSNNFKTYSSVRKSLENVGGNSSNCTEVPNRANLGNSENHLNQGNLVVDTIVEEKRCSPVAQRNSSALPVLPSNTQDTSPPEDTKSVRKSPKVGWTLYDNVMCQVNEILHNTQDDQGEGQRQIFQEVNQSKLVLNTLHHSALEQLKVLGFTFDTSALSEGRSLVVNNNRRIPIPIDASYYPRLDYQANGVQTSGSTSDNNTSLHMRALAMKYLGTRQLPNVSTQSREVELLTSAILNKIPGTSMNAGPRDGNPPKYLMHSEQNGHNILDISSLKRQLKKQEQQKICFGSGECRDVGLKQGASSFMRCYMKEDFPNVGPGRYDIMGAFKTISGNPCPRSLSRKGYGGLARFAVAITHTEDYPAPCDYNVPTFPDEIKEMSKPFGSTAKRKTFYTNQNPGPGLYRNTSAMKQRIFFDHTFGGSVKLRLGVEIKCCKRNMDICGICNEKPIGDYWHMNNHTYLCRNCMTSEHQRPRKHTRKELSNFRKIRDCSMIHSHEGTDAKLWRMHPRAIHKWSQKEAYLCSYFRH